ncbi:CGNR zinc finger domain-containing protein [Cohnella sp. AR92]|uniref:CGNR zinc finger domain-containing protein n=1 Tax=Cohnella sp. AR92 TaxID=648716 RepID=UPI00131595D9|nr:CGNR zinc finger domain-containing protein [Cohnella sp. AR92]
MLQTINRIGGLLWINLANTVRMQEKSRTDRLLDPPSLLEWLRDNELPDSVRELPLEQLRKELTALRELCDRVLEDLARHGKLSEPTYDALQVRAEKLIVGVKLTMTGEGPDLEYTGRSGSEALSLLVLRSIADTLRTVPAERIRKCEHEDCILRFADISKGGRRRWCSMETCGNRHKAAEFYAKKKQQAEG